MKNLVATIRIFLQATPDKAVRQKIINDLQSLTYINDIHHIHLWSLDGNNDVLTAHLTLNNPVDTLVQAKIKDEIATLLIPYDLSHTTIELEFPNETCRDKY